MSLIRPPTVTDRLSNHERRIYDLERQKTTTARAAAAAGGGSMLVASAATASANLSGQYATTPLSIPADVTATELRVNFDTAPTVSTTVEFTVNGVAQLSLSTSAATFDSTTGSAAVTAGDVVKMTLGDTDWDNATVAVIVTEGGVSAGLDFRYTPGA